MLLFGIVLKRRYLKMLSKYYIFHTSCDYVDAVCSLIKFVGGSVHTIITNREIPEGSINHYRVYCRLSWVQMMRLKRRLEDGKNKFIELSCYKRVNKFVYKLAWRRIIPHYTLQRIRKIKPDFGCDVQ